MRGIVALSDMPGYLSTLDCSGRWGIKPMFSGFKPRGLGVEHTQLRHPDRLARLLLVMALALCSAVFTGAWDQARHPTPAGKLLTGQQTRKPKPQPRSLARSALSLFTRRLRRIVRLMQAAQPPTPLWHTWKLIGG